MNRTAPRLALAAALAAGLGIALRIAMVPLASAEVPPAQAATAPPTAPVHRGDPDSLGKSLVGRDPFRTARRPAVVAYDPVVLAHPPAPAPAKPVLALAGILWDGGADPTALVEGLPGVDGARIVRSGDLIGSLRIKAIGRERVVVAGMDTIWVLVVKEPWE